MADNKIKAVLFDLGETLLCFGKVDVVGIFREAAHHSCEYLEQIGQPVANFNSYLWKNLLGIRLKLFISDLTGNDFDSLEVLKKYGAKAGINLNDEQWEEVNWSWYEPLSKKASFENNLDKTLATLKDGGIKLGIVSNTFVNGGALDRHLEQEGLLEFFDVRVYSHMYKFRKPDTRLFAEAVRQIGVDAKNIMFVGDRIDNDVKGSMRAGMVPVLKNAYTNKKKFAPKGVARIDKISQLPELIERINSQ